MKTTNAPDIHAARECMEVRLTALRNRLGIEIADQVKRGTDYRVKNVKRQIREVLNVLSVLDTIDG